MNQNLGKLDRILRFALAFSALNIAHKSWKGIFFKTAGIIVIALALFNFTNALVTVGIINPLQLAGFW